MSNPNLYLRQNFRIYPNKIQRSILSQWIGSCRFIWNQFLKKTIDLYKETGKFVFAFDMCYELPKLKNTEETKWLRECEGTCLQNKIKDLDKALRQSFKSQKNRKGFPRFKSKKLDESGIRIVSGFALDAENSKLILPKQLRKNPSLSAK